MHHITVIFLVSSLINNITVSNTAKNRNLINRQIHLKKTKPKVKKELGQNRVSP